MGEQFRTAPWTFLGIWLWAAAVAGCRSWEPTEEDAAILPPIRMRPDTVALEVAVANLDSFGADRMGQVWSELDEQAIAVEQRRTLDRNGIRCGIMSAQIPAELRALLEPTKGGQPARLSDHQQIQSGYGETHDIALGPSWPQLAWSVTSAAARVRSGTCADATCWYELRTFPRGNGTAELELVPKIQHGQLRNRIAAQHDTLTLQPMAEEIALSEVAFACRLKPGETLIIGPTSAKRGLGEIFLAGPAGGVRVVLVRLARTQMDDLFAPRQWQRSLTTIDP
jgi:hypothetical protein